jgi:hypothetical protein
MQQRTLLAYTFPKENVSAFFRSDIIISYKQKQTSTSIHYIPSSISNLNLTEQSLTPWPCISQNEFSEE